MAVVAKRAEKLLGVVVDQRLPCPTGCPRPAADRCLCGWKKP